MGLTATLSIILDVNQTPTGLYYASGVPKSKVPWSHVMNGSSDVPATTFASKAVALSSGTGAIDLTALTDWGLNAADPDATGLKLQVLTLQGDASNAGNITITPSGTNGYDAIGASFSVTLEPGQEIAFFGNEKSPDVSSSAKALTLAGTGSDVLNIGMLFG